MSRTGSWHTVSRRSLRAAHCGHSYTPWSVAPNRESISIPIIPAATIHAADRGAMSLGSKILATPAIAPAPANPPPIPRSEIPPDVPLGTGRPVVSSRGGVGENAPISVAQVSAAAAASAPAATVHCPHSAATAATPPLAIT